MARRRRKAPRETVKVWLSPEKHESCIRAGTHCTANKWHHVGDAPTPPPPCGTPYWCTGLTASYLYSHYHAQSWLWCFHSLQTPFNTRTVFNMMEPVWNLLHWALAVLLFMMFCLFVLFVVGFPAQPAHKETIVTILKIPSTQRNMFFLCLRSPKMSHLDYTDLYLFNVCH